MIMRIHCDYCGGVWEVYGDRINDDARTCPHCFSEVDVQTWKDYMVPAFLLTADANKQLLMNHTGNHTPMFTFDLIDNTYFKNRV